MQRFILGTKPERQLFRMQVIVLDTAEMLGLARVASDHQRCHYVEQLLIDLEYPVTSLPWEPLPCKWIYPEVDPRDLAGFYKDLRYNLVQLSYMGEELIVSPSTGGRVLIYYYKERT